MADSKITALASIGTGTDPANDPLVIVDVSDILPGGMSLTGTTKKVTLNNLLACSPTATLASATITGDLTVDTSTLKVVSSTDRVGIGTASPAKRCEINQSANAITTIGAGEILRLIGDDGNTIGRITEIGFGTGPTGAVYAPVTLGAINTSIAGYNNKDFYIATRTSTADIAPVERYRIANDGVATWSNVGGGAGTAMTLNATGLGVGVSPAVKLDIGGAATQQFRIQMSGQADTRVISDTGAGIIGTYSNHQLIIRTNSTNAVFVDASQNVGIGVTPSANGEKLNANGTIISTNQSIGGFALNQAGFDYSTSTKNLRIFSGTSNATGSSMSFVVGTSTSFLTALTLNSLGDFGVGITSPSYRLHSIVASGADKNIFAAQVSGASNGFEVKWNHATTTLRVIVSNLPTSSAGLASGTLWIDTAAGNTLKVA